MSRRAPWPPVRRRRTTRRRAGPGRRLVRALVWTGFGLAATALAPVLDDLRSGLRRMEPGCRAVRVIDGDTLDLVCDGAAPVRARIVGYDSPELATPACAAERIAAEAARRHLAALVAGPLDVAFMGTDRYGRDLVDLRADGVRVTTRMVADGHGRRYLGGLRGGWC